MQKPLEQVELEINSRSELEQAASIPEKETGLIKELADMLMEKVYVFPNNRLEVR